MSKVSRGNSALMMSFSAARPQQAEASFLAWANAVLPPDLEVESLEEDFRDGVRLAALAGVLLKRPLPPPFPQPRMKVQRLDNMVHVRASLERAGVRVDGVDFPAIVAGGRPAKAAVMALLYQQILVFGVDPQNERRVLEGLRARVASSPAPPPVPDSLGRALLSAPLVTAVVASVCPDAQPVAAARAAAASGDPVAALAAAFRAAEELLAVPPPPAVPAEMLAAGSADAGVAGMYFQTLLANAERLARMNPDQRRAHESKMIARRKLARDREIDRSAEDLRNREELQRGSDARNRLEAMMQRSLGSSRTSMPREQAPLQAGPAAAASLSRTNPLPSVPAMAQPEARMAASASLPAPPAAPMAATVALPALPTAVAVQPRPPSNPVLPINYPPAPRMALPAVAEPVRSGGGNFPAQLEGHVQVLEPGLYRCLLNIVPPVTRSYAARRPLDVLLCIDRSGSMDSGGRMQSVKASLSVLLQLMRPDDRCGLIVFDDAQQILASVASPLKKDLLAAQFAGLSPTGSTNILGALKACEIECRRMRPDAEKVLLLLTDGFDNRCELPHEEDIVAMMNLDTQGVPPHVAHSADFVRARNELRAEIMRSIEHQHMDRSQRLAAIVMQYNELISLQPRMAVRFLGCGEHDAMMMNAMVQAAPARGQLRVCNDANMASIFGDVLREITGKLDGTVTMQLEAGPPDAIMRVFAHDPSITVTYLDGTYDRGSNGILLQFASVSQSTFLQLGLLVRSRSGDARVDLRALYSFQNEDSTLTMAFDLGSQRPIGSAAAVANYGIRAHLESTLLELSRAPVDEAELRTRFADTLVRGMQACDTIGDADAARRTEFLREAHGQLAAIYRYELSEVVTEERLRNHLIRVIHALAR